jgi:hypothetical protein
MSSLLSRVLQGSWLGLATIALILTSGRCLAQTDEIQVYDAEIAGKGAVNLMVHSNFTVSGLKTPAFPGAVVSNHAFVGVAEWAYGVTSWFEQGLYLPLYSDSTNLGGTYNGFKIRELFVKPEAEKQTFFYGINFEFSVNQPQWNSRHYSSEVRPIIGWHFKPPSDAGWHQVDLIINPIVDTDWRGGFKSLDFAPSVRLAYNLNDAWQVAVEEYADFGEFRNIPGVDGQFHQIWAVADHKSDKWLNIEMGIGFGLTSASDKVTLKLMLSRDLISAKKDVPKAISGQIR